MNPVEITVDDDWQSPGPEARGWMSGEYDPGWVSVILPAYNREAFIGEAIASVIAQTYRPIELIVVDDGSTDATAATALDALQPSLKDPQFRSIIVRQSNRGASAARNQALMRSHGEFIQYQDSDDVLIASKLANHVRALRNDHALDVVGSDWEVVASEKLQSVLEKANRRVLSQSEHQSQAVRSDRMLPWEPWPLLYRRRLTASRGPWNARVSRWDDWEYVLRLLRHPPRLAWMPGIYSLQRRHDRGQRQDYDHSPDGVELGLVACREARTASEGSPRKRSIRNLVAIRYWETGVEALQHGTRKQAIEAFLRAANMAKESQLKLKAYAGCLIVGFVGQQCACLLLRRYLRSIPKETRQYGNMSRTARE